jgi:hypothetical protein
MVKRMMFNVAFVLCKVLQFNALFAGVWFCAWLACRDGCRPAQAGLICFDVGGGEVACAPLAPMKVQSIDNADVAQLDRA